MWDDTIAAIATPLGEGGIGIVRVSGPEAMGIAGRLFQSASGANWRMKGSHRLFRGRVVDPANGRLVDEILLGVMRAPHTYTREDVVEFNCHGGIVAVRRVLELALSAGARLAAPGEFTRRAFLNGRIDLAQAEAVIDLIRARTDTGLEVAAGQLTGRLSRRVRQLQDELLGLVARVEASIDFPEEDAGFNSADDLECGLADLIDAVARLIRQAETGRVYREGISTVIAGRPNVGKSSLLNALLDENRAIVTDIPGTTRDVIEEVLNVRGIPLRLADTAGLRETADKVEKAGVERARELLQQAELVLLVIDAGAGLTDADRELIKLAGHKKGLILINKSDLGGAAVITEQLREMDSKPVLSVSARFGTGLEQLLDAIGNLVLSGAVAPAGDLLVSNVRHQDALKRCLNHLKAARLSLAGHMPVDLAAIDLREAWEALGEITGTAVSEDIIDRIFSDFCIGK
ncbi:tRNA uridine-5-carboxymethylaminomethyl(34) synthesis GTPase MnmE [Desulfotomaculum copahuensis]|uniref:tRNA modification GTPase MnmE n=1 Tax=Desulfotomaculum copahuensis TaxID=1838280 RepID=A0A1B7LBM6_9FIRM|nr:tRNA uridine-5-carboxymethylaminomethyl(34) synthesis GTPase MnmE [Desulfotomaculum copahuensis]OAT79883.1 tRNA uridine(34) 5-carboxymethylaminomethyl synthesis GTPase MnmE [Desulfotomaculum copahuensis]